MKFERFPREFVSWDRYEAFHVGVGHSGFFRPHGYTYPAVVLFDTGELIVFNADRRPHWRGDYPAVGVSLLTTKDIPLYDLEGNRVPGRQLNYQGAQQILVDWSTGRAVGTGWCRDPNSRIPPRLQSKCGAYIAGPGADPVGAPITLHKPLKKYLTADEYTHFTDRLKAARVAMTLTEDPATKNPSWWWNRRRVSFERFMGVPWGSLSIHEKTALFHNGVSRPETSVPYLLTSPDGSPYRA